MSSKNFNKKSDDKAEQEALKEAEIVATNHIISFSTRRITNSIATKIATSKYLFNTV